MRAARALQNWSVPDLAEAARVSVSTIRRIEDNDAPVRPRAQNLAALQQALEAA
ncbi:helix-turn-helix domain-containing protein, partial [Stenotrophomonas maltophilia]|uniref:helix-turn-helix domain-containing protein n=1 Tax=Stenotrophomonas maltophilia TaxID=40324 RepID=UPI0013D99BA3